MAIRLIIFWSKFWHPSNISPKLQSLPGFSVTPKNNLVRNWKKNSGILWHIKFPFNFTSTFFHETSDYGLCDL